jgi:hypothetical protein
MNETCTETIDRELTEAELGHVVAGEKRENARLSIVFPQLRLRPILFVGQAVSSGRNSVRVKSGEIYER